ncbi:MAG TPA: hypothetical protein VF621_11270, partial [Pyrinomonadaceae bacterium]
KDLQNKKWLRELEVEVKNTGTKPIYYIHLSLHTPDVLLLGHPYGFSMRYGRKELIYPETAVEPGDVPIMPGESVTLRPSEQTVKAYEHGQDELRDRGDPKKVVCWVQVLKFGDGTALRGPDGELRREGPRSSSLNVPDQKNGAGGCRSSSALSTMKAPDGFFKVSDSWKPASLLRAYLLLTGSREGAVGTRSGSAALQRRFAACGGVLRAGGMDLQGGGAVLWAGGHAASTSPRAAGRPPRGRLLNPA